MSFAKFGVCQPCCNSDIVVTDCCDNGVPNTLCFSGTFPSDSGVGSPVVLLQTTLYLISSEISFGRRVTIWEGYTYVVKYSNTSDLTGFCNLTVKITLTCLGGTFNLTAQTAPNSQSYNYGESNSYSYLISSVDCINKIFDFTGPFGTYAKVTFNNNCLVQNSCGIPLCSYPADFSGSGQSLTFSNGIYSGDGFTLQCKGTYWEYTVPAGTFNTYYIYNYGLSYAQYSLKSYINPVYFYIYLDGIQPNAAETDYSKMRLITGCSNLGRYFPGLNATLPGNLYVNISLSASQPSPVNCSVPNISVPISYVVASDNYRVWQGTSSQCDGLVVRYYWSVCDQGGLQLAVGGHIIPITNFQILSLNPFHAVAKTADQSSYALCNNCYNDNGYNPTFDIEITS